MRVKQYLKDFYKELATEVYNDPPLIGVLVLWIIVMIVIIAAIVLGFIFQPIITAIILFVILSIAGLTAMIYFHGRQYDEGKR